MESKLATCLTCKTEFTPRSKRQVTCSKECALEENRRKARLRGAKKREGIPPRDCDICGASLAGQYRHRRRCRGECQAKFVREWQNRAYAERPEFREQKIAYSKQYALKNADEILAKRRKYYEENAEEIRHRVRQYARSNPELVAGWNRNRRARRRNRKTERYTRQDVVALYGTTCYLCLTAIDLEVLDHFSPRYLTVDHVIPLIEDGDDVLTNVRPAHQVCNLRKNKRLLHELDLPFPPPVSEMEPTQDGHIQRTGDPMDS